MDIRHNVGLRPFQPDIGGSDIRLSPISFITDIRPSAHLCLYRRLYVNYIVELNPCTNSFNQLASCRLFLTKSTFLMGLSLTFHGLFFVQSL
jgi:hypothetical protein